jgi:hypothetical protein
MEMPVVEPPVKEKKSTGAIIGSVAAIVLCGVTGLLCLCPISISMFAAPDLYAQNGISGVTSAWGIAPLCLAVVFIAIGVVVPVLLLKKKKPAVKDEILPPQDPLPPAS